MSKGDHEGTLHREYIEGRKKKHSLKYRLWRRSFEVGSAIKKYSAVKKPALLDIGTSDGKMLEILMKDINFSSVIGIDLAPEVLKNKIANVKFIQANALKLPFKKTLFDVVISAATIEHVSDPAKFCKEVHRVLNKEGIIIVTTPAPFFESIATKTKYLKEDQHNFTFGKKELTTLFEKNGFKVLKFKRFMISPVGFPFEQGIEKGLSTIMLDFLFCNQLLVAKKI